MAARGVALSVKLMLPIDNSNLDILGVWGGGLGLLG